jgi:SAM-dependent methyltransferase
MTSRLVEQAQGFIAAALRPGDIALDATVGNGHDALFLAQAAGEAGWVYGLDIQEQALAATRERLDQAGMADRVTLMHRDHADLAGPLPPVPDRDIRAAMMNLGYLPGSGKGVITRAGSTLAALQGITIRLAPGGRLSVLAYTRHPGGLDEARAVCAWAHSLSPRDWDLRIRAPCHTRRSPPWLLTFTRREEAP